VFMGKDCGGFSVDMDRDSSLLLEAFGSEMYKIVLGWDISGQDVGDTAGSIGDNPALADHFDRGLRLAALDLDRRRQSGCVGSDNEIVRHSSLLSSKPNGMTLYQKSVLRQRR